MQVVYLYVSFDYPYFLYVIVYVCALFASTVNCIVYTLMYVHIFSYLVNKLEIWWVYLSPIAESGNNSPIY